MLGKLLMIIREEIRSKGDFDKFRKIFCALHIREWKPTSKNQKVLNGILTNLEKIKEENCSKN